MFAGADWGLWVNALVLSGLGAGVAFSVRERRNRRKRQWRSSSPVQQTPLQSPLSQAVAHLVGTAGGIYLSLEVLCSFLGVKNEEWPAITPLSLDPLAAFSLIIAIIQPFAVRAWEAVKNVRHVSRERRSERVSKGKSKKRR